MQIISSLGDNLHEISKPIFWGGKKNRKNVIIVSSTEFEYRVVKVDSLPYVS